MPVMFLLVATAYAQVVYQDAGQPQGWGFTNVVAVELFGTPPDPAGPPVPLPAPPAGGVRPGP